MHPTTAPGDGRRTLPLLPACGLINVDRAGVIVNVNTAILEWTGSESVELIGRPLETFLTLRMPLARADGLRPTDATLHGTSGIVRPVVVGAIDGIRADNGMQIAVYDVSERTAFALGFHGAEAKTERARRRLQILLNAAVGFGAVRTETEAAELLVDVAERAFAATAVSVHLREPDGVVQVAGVNPLAPHWPAGFAPAGAFTLARGQVLVVRSPDDADRHAPGAGMSTAYRASGIEAAIASPIRSKGESLGSMVCYFDHPREFDEEAVPLAEALSNQAAQAIARVRLEESLRRAAMHDEVTGLPRRRLFEEDATQALLSDFPVVAVIFADLDGFKAVNDLLGHPAGDDLLREVGTRLRGVIRERDILGRFGGDEFVIVAAVDHPIDAESLAERIRASVAEPYDGLAELSITASIGVVTVEYPESPVIIDQLIRAADHAMYDAKLSGGDRVATREFRPTGRSALPKPREAAADASPSLAP
ncbi:sensor domain-containing diguanylate cyclase [Agromyces ramosus]|uniref:Diguanylate cyclase (GGDEF)-like protein n=1 Tax=Agromyces ramosus TaxID=33879 RepID=A0ABU0RAV4_9MICO|nr:sensor domain-containing diguanylate cyclase [Agromyces ramosus]MDQ0895203.1 diguanylate cyclase (GGDEF)-like protein [Agromyces ramosus]